MGLGAAVSMGDGQPEPDPSPGPSLRAIYQAEFQDELARDAGLKSTW
jgi:hypothetical protein